MDKYTVITTLIVAMIFITYIGFFYYFIFLPDEKRIEYENSYTATPIVDLALTDSKLAIMYAQAYDLRLESVNISDHNITIRLSSTIDKHIIYKTYKDILTTRQIWYAKWHWNMLKISLNLTNGSYNLYIYCNGVLGATAKLAMKDGVWELRNIRINITKNPI